MRKNMEGCQSKMNQKKQYLGSSYSWKRRLLCGLMTLILMIGLIPLSTTRVLSESYDPDLPRNKVVISVANLVSSGLVPDKNYAQAIMDSMISAMTGSDNGAPGGTFPFQFGLINGFFGNVPDGKGVTDKDGHSSKYAYINSTATTNGTDITITDSTGTIDLKHALFSFVGHIKANNRGITNMEGTQWLRHACGIDLSYNNIPSNECISYKRLCSYADSEDMAYYQDDQGDVNLSKEEACGISWFGTFFEADGEPYRTATVTQDTDDVICMINLEHNPLVYMMQAGGSINYWFGNNDYGNLGLATILNKPNYLPDSIRFPTAVIETNLENEDHMSRIPLALEYCDVRGGQLNREQSNDYELYVENITRPKIRISVGSDLAFYYMTAFHDQLGGLKLQHISSFSYYCTASYHMLCSATAEASGSSSGSVTLTKNDIDSKDTLLSGAVFNLYKKSTTGGEDTLVIADGKSEWTSDAEGKITVENLESGDYYFKEIVAPTGYILSTDSAAFTIPDITARIVGGNLTSGITWTAKSKSLIADDTTISIPVSANEPYVLCGEDGHPLKKDTIGTDAETSSTNSADWLFLTPSDGFLTCNNVVPGNRYVANPRATLIVDDTQGETFFDPQTEDISIQLLVKKSDGTRQDVTDIAETEKVTIINSNTGKEVYSADNIDDANAWMKTQIFEYPIHVDVQLKKQQNDIVQNLQTAETWKGNEEMPAVKLEATKKLLKGNDYIDIPNNQFQFQADLTDWPGAPTTTFKAEQLTQSTANDQVIYRIADKNGNIVNNSDLYYRNTNGKICTLSGNTLTDADGTTLTLGEGQYLVEVKKIQPSTVYTTNLANTPVYVLSPTTADKYFVVNKNKAVIVAKANNPQSIASIAQHYGKYLTRSLSSQPGTYKKYADSVLADEDIVINYYNLYDFTSGFRKLSDGTCRLNIIATKQDNTTEIVDNAWIGKANFTYYYDTANTVKLEPGRGKDSVVQEYVGNSDYTATASNTAYNAEADKGGNIIFPKFHFLAGEDGNPVAGTYTFTITENGSGTAINGVSYNPAGRVITATVLVDEKGNIGEPIYTSKDQDSTKPVNKNNQTFSNKVEEGAFSLSINKTLNGETTDLPFSFTATMNSFKDNATAASISIDADNVGNYLSGQTTNIFHATNSNGKVGFPFLKVLKAGIYTFTITEDNNQTATGTKDCLLDARTITAVVTVTSELVCTVSYTDGNNKTLDTLNNMTKLPITLQGTKYFDNLASNELFYFGATLTKVDDIDITSDNYMVYADKISQTAYNQTTGENTGLFEFMPFNVKKAGTYTFIVSETSKNSTSAMCDSTVYTATVTVEEINGKLTAGVVTYSVNGVGKDAMTFNNYSALSIQLKANKKLNGVPSYKQFTFTATLDRINGNQVDRATGMFGTEKLKDYLTMSGAIEYVQTATNEILDSTQGNINFRNIRFYKPGTYTFILAEPTPDQPVNGVTYSTDTITATVTVIQSSTDGSLSETIVYSSSEPSFENTYETTGTTATIEVNKQLTGKLLEAGMFSFVIEGKNITAANNTVTNDGSGKITFGPINYTYADLDNREDKTYNYVISEVEPESPMGGVTYTTKEIKVCVNLKDNGDGTMSAKVVYPSIDEQDKTLTNTYSDNIGVLTVSKTVSGKAASATQIFNFTVTLNRAITGTYGDLTFENGKAVFSMKAGESKTAKGLPVGVKYTVTESNNEGYTVTVNGVNTSIAQGTISAKKKAVAAFNNNKEAPSGGHLPPDTGDASDFGIWLLLMVGSLLSAVVIVFYGRRQQQGRKSL